MRDRLPDQRTEGPPSSRPSEEERELLRRYVDAHERTDADALAELLREDVRLTMPPHPTWYAGRDAIMIGMRQGFEPGFGHLRSIVAGANMQPAAAHYLRPPGESEHRPLALDVLRIEGGTRRGDRLVPLPRAVSGVRPPADSLSERASDEFFAALRCR